MVRSPSTRLNGQERRRCRELHPQRIDSTTRRYKQASSFFKVALAGNPTQAQVNAAYVTHSVAVRDSANNNGLHAVAAYFENAMQITMAYMPLRLTRECAPATCVCADAAKRLRQHGFRHFDFGELGQRGRRYRDGHARRRRRERITYIYCFVATSGGATAAAVNLVTGAATYTCGSACRRTGNQPIHHRRPWRVYRRIRQQVAGTESDPPFRPSHCDARCGRAQTCAYA